MTLKAFLQRGLGIYGGAQEAAEDRGPGPGVGAQQLCPHARRMLAHR